MTKNKKGFTIIEVVLVLAIAGLIFLMVFIALPALQRSQRNTRRRQDMARILSAFTEYASNNNGQIPEHNDATNGWQLNNFVNNYVNGGGTQNASGSSTCTGDQFCDPDGSPYVIDVPVKVTANNTQVFNDGVSFGDAGHEIKYYTNASCGSSENHVNLSNGSRDIAIFYMLEGGAVYCGDNH